MSDRKPNFCHSRNSLLSFLRRQESSKLLCSLDSCLRRNDTNGLEFGNKGLFGQTLSKESYKRKPVWLDGFSFILKQGSALLVLFLAWLLFILF